jgi:membrane associated rhomboid family serine protease
MTLYIVIATCIISYLALQNPATMHKLIFNSVAVSERGEWWRFISSGFVHGSWMHLIFNMLALYSFGVYVEHIYGNLFDVGSTYKFLILYFGGMVVAMLPSYHDHKHDPMYNSLGASGAVSAVLFVFILYAPLQKIYFYGIFALPGVIMGAAFLLISYYMSKRGGDNINHSAHLWGALFGLAYTLALKPSLFSHFLSELSGGLNL